MIDTLQESEVYINEASVPSYDGIKKKIESGETLSRIELELLYDPSQYEDDFESLRDGRDVKKDAAVMLDCQPEQIAWDPSELSEQTKVYVGPLFAGVFEKTKQVDQLFTSFPSGRITRETFQAGGKSREAVESEFAQHGIQVTEHAKAMMEQADCFSDAPAKEVRCARLRVQDLNVPFGSDLQTMFAKAQELGLARCRAEVAIHRRLVDTNQPMGDSLYIAMEPLPNAEGNKVVFKLQRGGKGLRLGADASEPKGGWNPSDEFLFEMVSEEERE